MNYLHKQPKIVCLQKQKLNGLCGYIQLYFVNRYGHNLSHGFTCVFPLISPMLDLLSDLRLQLLDTQHNQHLIKSLYGLLMLLSDLRLQLLDTQHNQHLIKSLYGLLMLLPQSDAFRTLRHRLECVPNIQFLPPEER